MARRGESVAGIAFHGTHVFVARRSPGGDLGEKWEFPGGKVEGGETGEDAVRREFFEEFGLAVEAGAFIGVSSFEHGGIIFNLRAYRVFFDGNLLRTVKLKEHTEWRWASFEEIKTMDFAESDCSLFPALELYFNENCRVEQ